MNYVNCHLCGINNFKILFTNRKDKYLSVLRPFIKSARSKVSTITVVCKNCGLVYQNPQLDKHEINRLYYSSYRSPAFGYASEYPSSEYLRTMSQRNEKRIKWLERSLIELFRNNESRRILDIGCGAGVLLYIFKQRGWDTYGIEPSPIYSAFACEKYQLKVITDFFKKKYFSDQYFDLVAIIQTLEHIKDPINFLGSIRRILKENGYIFIEVPNLYMPKNSLEELFGAPHLYTFSAKTLKVILAKSGFEIIKMDSSTSDLQALAKVRTNKSPIPKFETEYEDYHKIYSFIKCYKKKYFINAGWKHKLKDILIKTLGKAKGEFLIRVLRQAKNKLAQKIKAFFYQLKYCLKAYFYLPITFTKRVIFGKSPYWKQYFWNKWGFIPRKKLTEIRQGKKIIWIDALSGGEVMQSRSFCRELKRNLPDYCIVFSTNSYDAYQAAKKIEGIDFLFDTPWDIGWVVKKTLKTLNPQLLIFIQAATHPILLSQAKKMKVSTLLASGFMSKDWHTHPTMQRPMIWQAYKYLDYIGAKEDSDKAGFQKMGINDKALEVVGNLQFDADDVIVSEADKVRILSQLRLRSDEPVFIGGSVNYGEDKILIDAYLKARKQISNLRLILAPRYSDRLEETERYIKANGLDSVRKSQISNQPSQTNSIILIDTFGELKRLYSIATVIFLGVTLIPRIKIGYGQNIIEPLLHGKPVFFGPYAKHWEEITAELERVWPKLRVKDADELAQGLVEITLDKSLLEALQRKAMEIVNRNRYAVRNNIEFITKILHAKGQKKNSTNVSS